VGLSAYLLIEFGSDASHFFAGVGLKIKLRKLSPVALTVLQEAYVSIILFFESTKNLEIVKSFYRFTTEATVATVVRPKTILFSIKGFSL
jgi:hypothetical protein